MLDPVATPLVVLQPLFAPIQVISPPVVEAAPAALPTATLYVVRVLVLF